MKNITINIPKLYDKQISLLITHGIVPSRSEAVRNAIREYLHKDLKFLMDLNKPKPKQDTILIPKEKKELVLKMLKNNNII